MASFTVADVLSNARDKLGDNTAVSAGRVITDAEFLSFMQSALLELNQITRNITGNAFSKREVYVFVPVNSGLILWDHLNILTDAAILDGIWERKIQTYQGITNVSVLVDVATITTDAPHGRSVGDQVTATGSIFPWINGLHTIGSVGGANSISVFAVRATTAGGAETSGASRLMYGIGNWTPITPTNVHLGVDQPLDGVNSVTFVDNGIRINPVNNERMLRISVLLGADTKPATTDQILYGDSIEYLALKIALLGHTSKGGNPERIAALREQLYGPGGDPASISGGAAALVRRGLILQGQWARNVRPRFRPPKTPTFPAIVRS